MISLVIKANIPRRPTNSFSLQQHFIFSQDFYICSFLISERGKKNKPPPFLMHLSISVLTSSWLLTPLEFEPSSTCHSNHRFWSLHFSARWCLHAWSCSFSPILVSFHQPMWEVRWDCPCCGQNTGVTGASWRQGELGRKHAGVGRVHVESTGGRKAGLETVPLSLNNVHNISALPTLLDFFLCHLVGNDFVRISLHSANRFSEALWITGSDSRLLPALCKAVAMSLPCWSSQLSCSQGPCGIN